MKILAKSLKEKQKQIHDKFRANPRLWIEQCVKILDKNGNERDFVFNNIQEEYYNELIRLYWKPYSTAKDGTVIYRFQGIREIIQKGRQLGGSSLICVIYEHDTIFFKGTKTYIFCQDETKSSEMLRDKVKYYYDSIDQDDDLIVLPQKILDNESTLRFDHKSVIQALTPGSSTDIARKKGRSITLRNLMLSEMAEYADAETLWQGIVPAIPETANVIIESSPHVRLSGPFYKSLYDEGKKPGAVFKSRFWAWHQADWYIRSFIEAGEREDFEAKLDADEKDLLKIYPHMTLEKLNWRRFMIASFGGGEKGLRKFKADYPSDDLEGFKVSDEKLFFAKSEFNLFKTLGKKKEPESGLCYLMVCDTSEGRGGDNQCIHVYHPKTREQVFRWADNKVDVRYFHRQIHKVFLKYPSLVLIEINNTGHTVASLARRIDDPFFQNMIYRRPEGDGFRTGTNKEQFLFDLREELELAEQTYGALESGQEPDLHQGIRFSYEETVDEMMSFIDNGDATYGAASGKTDDDIICAGIATHGFRHMPAAQKRFNKYIHLRMTKTIEHDRDYTDNGAA